MLGQMCQCSATWMRTTRSRNAQPVSIRPRATDPPKETPRWRGVFVHCTASGCWLPAYSVGVKVIDAQARFERQLALPLPEPQVQPHRVSHPHDLDPQALAEVLAEEEPRLGVPTLFPPTD